MLFRSITLQEANACLPLIKERFARIQALAAEGLMLHEVLGSDKPALESGSGLHEVAVAEDESFQVRQRRFREIEELVREEVSELQQFGAKVKSVFPARVDFLAQRHKQPVYLCWQMGDQDVAHWHPIDEGFSSRRPIQAPETFGPTVIH